MRKQDSASGAIFKQHSLMTSTLQLEQYRTVRILLALAAAFDLDILQLDAVNAFINAELDEIIYLKAPEGFYPKGTVLLLLRALYGLKRAPLLWNIHLSKTLKNLGFNKINEDQCLYIHPMSCIIIFFYVDDILVLSPQSAYEDSQTVIQQLQRTYEVRNLGQAEWFLNLRITRDRSTRTLWICQDRYIEKIAEKFSVTTYPRIDTPLCSTINLYPQDSIAPQTTAATVNGYQQKIGSILYAAIITRPDIAFASSKLASLALNPSEQHISMANRTLAYLYQTRHYAIEYKAPPIIPATTQELTSTDVYDLWHAASDASYADTEGRKSSQGYIIKLFNGPISWQANRQNTITLSTTEAEILSMTNIAKEITSVIRLFNGLRFNPEIPIPIRCDNRQSVDIINGKNNTYRTKMKHVDIHQLWLRQEVNENRISIQWVPTTDMIADGLTKALPRLKHQHFLKQIGFMSIQDLIPKIMKS